MAALGLLAAERHRRLTGQGQAVDIALKDVGLAMLATWASSAKSPSTVRTARSTAMTCTGRTARASSPPTVNG